MGADDAQYCSDRHTNFYLCVHNITTIKTDDIHFRLRPVDSFVDNKWWPFYRVSSSADSTRLITALKLMLTVNGWDRAGRTGRSRCNNGCDKVFLEGRPRFYKTGTRGHL